jgi:hypothetical protein
MTLILLILLAQSLPPDQMAAAIAAGTAKKTGGVRIGAGGYTLLVRGPAGRVTDLAREHAIKFQPFTAEQVNAKHLVPMIEVFVQPNPPELVGRQWRVHGPVTQVVIRAKGQTGVLQPASLTQHPVEWANALGGKFQSTGAVATFNLADLPAGELEILIPYSDGSTAKGTLKVKDRDKIR